MPIVVDPVVIAASLVDEALAGVTMPPLESALPAEAQPATVPEAVAAAAEPIPAQEPQPTPPPPQPQVPDPDPVPEELSSPPELNPAPVEQPQYQPEPPQYQPSETVAAAETSEPQAPTPVEPADEEWSWDWTWSCGSSGAPVQVPTVEGDDLPETWNWNWSWNCAGNKSGQYQSSNAQYHPVNVNVSIRVGSPGDNGPVTQTNVLVVVAARPVTVTAQTIASAPTAAAPPAEPIAAAEPSSSAPAAAAEPSAEQQPDAGPETTFAPAGQMVAPAEAPSWNARPIPPRLQPTNTEAHRNRPQLRRPTRRPLPPMRAPVFPVSSAGAAPLGGSDGGAFQLALLLVPFALALVDSARRLVRDTAPPVGRGHKKRRKRPG
jgi:hypothetical protein